MAGSFGKRLPVSAYRAGLYSRLGACQGARSACRTRPPLYAWTMPSVFHRTGSFAAAAVRDPSTLITPGRLQGQTQHFAVDAEAAPGADGAQDAKGVLAA